MPPDSKHYTTSVDLRSRTGSTGILVLVTQHIVCKKWLYCSAKVWLTFKIVHTAYQSFSLYFETT